MPELMPPADRAEFDRLLWLYDTLTAQDVDEAGRRMLADVLRMLKRSCGKEEL